MQEGQYIYRGHALLLRQVQLPSFSIMASSVDPTNWDSFLKDIKCPSKGLPRPTSQPALRPPPTDAASLPETRDWFSSPPSKQVKPSRIASSRHRPSTQNLSLSLPSEHLLSPPREPQPQPHTFATRFEVMQAIRAITDRLEVVEVGLHTFNDLKDE